MRRELAAALLATAAACGGSSDTTPDAARGPDAAVDAPIDSAIDAVPDAPGGHVTVLVKKDGVPVPGDFVYFLAGDDTLVASMQTDANGAASADVPSGASVTVLSLSSTTFNRLHTWFGVKGGDELHLYDATTPPTPVYHLTLKVPADPNPMVAHTYVSTGCGVVEVNPADVPGTAANLTCYFPHASAVVYTTDANENQLDAFYVPTITYVDGTTATYSGTYAAVGDVLATVSGLDDSFADVRVFLALDPSYDYASEQVVPSSNGEVMASLTFLADPTPTRKIWGSLGIAGHHRQSFYRNVGASASYGVDLTGMVMAPITTGASIDTANARVAWTTTGPGATPDWSYASVTDANAPWSWDLVGPSTAGGGIRLPAIPSDLIDPHPHDGDSVGILPAGSTIQPGGYDAHRASAFDQTLPVDYGAEGLMLINDAFDPALP